MERDHRNLAVFASALAAPTLDELREASATEAVLNQRLDQSQALKAAYRNELLPLFADEESRAWNFLTRLQIRTADETSLRVELESKIALLFYQEQGTSIDAGAVRRLLAEYLLDHMHQEINAAMLLKHLAAEGIRRKDWKVDATVRESG